MLSVRQKKTERVLPLSRLEAGGVVTTNHSPNTNNQAGAAKSAPRWRHRSGPELHPHTSSPAARCSCATAWSRAPETRYTQSSGRGDSGAGGQSPTRSGVESFPPRCACLRALSDRGTCSVGLRVGSPLMSSRGSSAPMKSGPHLQHRTRVCVYRITVTESVVIVYMQNMKWSLCCH